MIKLYDRFGTFPSGRHRRIFLKKLAKYCDFYRYDIKKRIYKITKIYEIPRIGIFEIIYDNPIYKHLVVLYLNELMRLEKHDKGLVVRGLTLMLHLKILHPNYMKLHKAERSLCKTLNIKPTILRGFFNRTSTMMRYYVGEIIYRLCELDCIELFPTYITREMKPVFFKAEGIEYVRYRIGYVKHFRMSTPEEILIHDAAMAKATQEATNEEEVEQIFKDELKKHDIYDIFLTYEARVKNKENCLKVLRQFPAIKFNIMREKISIELKRIVDTLAEERAAKNNLPAEYVEGYKRLSSLTLLFDAPDYNFDTDLIYESFEKGRYKSMYTDRDEKGELIKL